MTSGKGMEVAYLKGTIGEALAEGCAATAIAAPGDPVEHLGLWLLKYVIIKCHLLQVSYRVRNLWK